MSAHVKHARTALLVAHVVSIGSLLGSELALLGLGAAGAAGTPANRVYPAASLIAHWVTLPAAAAALLTGIALSIATPWGLRRFGWVQAKLAITVVLTGLLLVLLLPALTGASDDAAAGGTVSDATQRQLLIAPALALSAMVLNAALGVAKPRRRFAQDREVQHADTPA